VNLVLMEIVLSSANDILARDMPIQDKYASIKKLFHLEEFDLNILFESIRQAKQNQINQKRKDLL